MSERQNKRKNVHLSATLIIGGQPYSGKIENVSVDGMRYSITSFLEKADGFSPSLDIALRFQAPSGEELVLDCELIWFSRVSSDDTIPLALGLRISDPPELYKRFVEGLVN